MASVYVYHQPCAQHTIAHNHRPRDAELWRAIAEGRDVAKPSIDTTGQGKIKPSAPVESRQHAIAAPKGQVAPTNGNKVDQPAAASPKRARQRKTEDAKSPTGAAPAPMPSAVRGESWRLFYNPFYKTPLPFM